MDPSEINNFEEQWRKAFKEASETPPPSVWEGIEARLDQEKEQGVILPLWWQSARIWYAAASVAALLLVGAGLWYANDGKQIDGNVEHKIAVQQKPVQQKETPLNPEIAASKTEQSPSDQVKIKGNPAADQHVGAAENSIASATEAKNTETIHKGDNRVNVKGESYAGKAKPNRANGHTGQAAVSLQKEASTLPIVETEVEKIAAVTTTAIDRPAAESEKVLTTTAQMLASLPYNDLNVHVQKRYVFFRPEIKIEEPVKLAKPKEYWAGLGLMPASFNPDLKVKEAPTAFSNQTVANKKSVSGTSESGVSYAIQTQGGMRISKHWSVEMGVSYLRGNSDYQGGGYVLNPYNSIAVNVLENALAGLSSPNASPSSFDKTQNFSNGALYIDVDKKVSNNYQYLQLPVQAGFTINPDKRLSYSLLGGMMANFFLTNELESASGEIITTTASDEIYRGMNWAATTGLRFNYRLSSKWNANLTGSYQKAISSGFRSNQSLEAHPYLYGVSWGVRYSF